MLAPVPLTPKPRVVKQKHSALSASILHKRQPADANGLGARLSMWIISRLVREVQQAFFRHSNKEHLIMMLQSRTEAFQNTTCRRKILIRHACVVLFLIRN